MSIHATKTVVMLAAVLGLAACQWLGTKDAPPPIAVHSTDPAGDFFRNLSALCGKAYRGRVVVDRPTQEGINPFAGKTLIMHVRECKPDVIRIPFYVGDDRSRTWVITHTDNGGLRLKHDHRHEDGDEDALSMYGGDTVEGGTPYRQSFPVDAESKDIFDREGRSVSNTNVWAMEIEPGEHFYYELSRPGRLFRIEFDLTKPIPAPPPPWGTPTP